MKEQDLDRIDQGIEALIAEIERQGHIGFISYCIQISQDGDEAVFESQLMSTEAKPSHYFLALRSWLNMIYKHFLDGDQ